MLYLISLQKIKLSHLTFNRFHSSFLEWKLEKFRNVNLIVHYVFSVFNRSYIFTQFFNVRYLKNIFIKNNHLTSFWSNNYFLQMWRYELNTTVFLKTRILNNFLNVDVFFVQCLCIFICLIVSTFSMWMQERNTCWVILFM